MKKGMKKITKCLVLALALILCMGGITKNSVAKAKDSEEPPQYNASGSIVQVVFLYMDENGVYHIIQSGSGVLLDDLTVITTRSTATLSDESKTLAGEYLSGLLEKQITFYPTEEEGWELATCELAVVIEADIYSMATVSFQSVDWDVATLSLASATNKECAVLGDSDLVESGDALSAQGFPSMVCTSPVSFLPADLRVNTGVCDRRENGVIKHTAPFETGSIGGALVDEYGRVVAIITYVPGENGVYSALPINQVKAYLDRDGVHYREDSEDYSYVEVVATTTDAEPEHVVVSSDLERVIDEADIILSEGNDDRYTEESFRALQVEYNAAKKICEDPKSSQLEIDNETDRLRLAIDSLEKVKKDNKALIVIIIVASALFLIVMTIIIVILVGKRSNKKKQEEESKKIRTIGGGSTRGGARDMGGYVDPGSQNLKNNIGLPSSQLYAQFDAKVNKERNNSSSLSMEPGTTILQETEGTTVLNSFVQAPINAYLYRSSTGESIAITSDTFRVGKNNEGLEYRIDGNTNVSRLHAVITRNFENYYIEDLGSTNYTFVNGVRVMPNRKQQLQTNDVIYLADEEFVFMMNS